MASLLQGTQVRLLHRGITLKRATALLPATGTGAIFVVSAGRILVTGFLGCADVASPATTNTLKVSTLATGGTGADLSTAVSVASKEAGSTISLTNVVGGALLVQNAGTPASLLSPFVLNPGSITVTTTGTAATGTWSWYLQYVPLDDNAYAAAA